MGAAATIPLQVQAPQIQSPIQTIGGLMQLKNGMADLALRQQQTLQAQQQTANIQAEQQQRNRDLADQNTIQDLMKDPAIGAKIASGNTTILQGKIQEKNRLSYQDNVQKFLEQKATTGQTELENEQKANGILFDTFQNLQSTFGDGSTPESVAKWNAELPNVLQRLDANGTLKLAGLDPTKIQNRISSPEDLAQLESGLRVKQAIADKALEIKGTQTKQALEQAQAGQASSEALLTNAKAAMIAKTPEERAAAVDAMNLDPDIASGVKAALAGATTPEGLQEAVTAGVRQQIERNNVSNPGMIAGKAASAKAEAEATAPIKNAQEIAARVGVAQAMNAAGPELAGVPIADRDKVRTEFEKSLTELSTSAADANRIHGLIAAAQGGNKAAPAVIPIAELRGFVNRVNQTELRATGGAGSLIDKVQGWVQGKTEGQPIPPDILKATDEIAALQLSNAEQKHNGEVQAINIARGSKLQAKKASDLGFAQIGVTTPTSQAEFDALPKGAHFRKPGDPKEYIKQ